MCECKNCKHGIFDPVWGEYKCRVRQHRIYKKPSIDICELYEKGTPTESKDEGNES